MSAESNPHQELQNEALGVVNQDDSPSASPEESPELHGKLEKDEKAVSEDTNEENDDDSKPDPLIIVKPLRISKKPLGPAALEPEQIEQSSSTKDLNESKSHAEHGQGHVPDVEHNAKPGLNDESEDFDYYVRNPYASPLELFTESPFSPVLWDTPRKNKDLIDDEPISPTQVIGQDGQSRQFSFESNVEETLTLGESPKPPVKAGKDYSPPVEDSDSADDLNVPKYDENGNISQACAAKHLLSRANQQQKNIKVESIKAAADRRASRKETSVKSRGREPNFEHEPAEPSKLAIPFWIQDLIETRYENKLQEQLKKHEQRHRMALAEAKEETEEAQEATRESLNEMAAKLKKVVQDNVEAKEAVKNSTAEAQRCEELCAKLQAEQAVLHEKLHSAEANEKKPVETGDFEENIAKYRAEAERTKKLLDFATAEAEKWRRKLTIEEYNSKRATENEQYLRDHALKLFKEKEEQSAMNQTLFGQFNDMTAMMSEREQEFKATEQDLKEKLAQAQKQHGTGHTEDPEHLDFVFVPGPDTEPELGPQQSEEKWSDEEPEDFEYADLTGRKVYGYQARYEKACRSIWHKDAELDDIQHANLALQNEVADNKCKIDAQQHEVNKLEKKLKSQTEKSKQLDTMATELSTTLKEVLGERNRMRNKLVESEEKIASFAAKCDDTIRSIKNELDNLKATLVDKEKSIQKHKDELKTQDQQLLSQHQHWVAEEKKRNVETNALKSKIKSLEKDYRDASAIVATSHEHHKERSKRIDKQIQEYAETMRLQDLEHQDKLNQVADENKALKDLAKQIRGQEKQAYEDQLNQLRAENKALQTKIDRRAIFSEENDSYLAQKHEEELRQVREENEALTNTIAALAVFTEGNEAPTNKIADLAICTEEDDVDVAQPRCKASQGLHRRHKPKLVPMEYERDTLKQQIQGLRDDAAASEFSEFISDYNSQEDDTEAHRKSGESEAPQDKERSHGKKHTGARGKAPEISEFDQMTHEAETFKKPVQIPKKSKFTEHFSDDDEPIVPAPPAVKKKVSDGPFETIPLDSDTNSSNFSFERTEFDAAGIMAANGASAAGTVERPSSSKGWFAGTKSAFCNMTSKLNKPAPQRQATRQLTPRISDREYMAMRDPTFFAQHEADREGVRRNVQGGIAAPAQAFTKKGAGQNRLK